MQHFITTSVAAAVLATSLSAQNIVLREDFNVAVPPAGWSQVKHNPAANGWIMSVDGRAWHEDESSGIGACDDELITPLLDFSAVPISYAHFKSQLNFATYLANHPGSVGDGETDLYVRINGGAWTEVWTDTRQSNTTNTISVDLTGIASGQSNVELAFRYYGTFAHETWMDYIQVDDSSTPPLDPPVAWANVGLPSSFVNVTNLQVCDDFESYGGVLPSHMAASALNSGTLLPDPEAWCTIAGGTYASASGVRNLEMGMIPGTTNYHNVRNSLVVGLNGAGQGAITVDFNGIDHGEELNSFDGVWISSDGLNWYFVYGDWGPLPTAWTAVSVNLGAWTSVTNGNFYLMFGQEDNFPYANLDGVGIDDLCVTGSGPTNPTLTVVGLCPGPVVANVTNATPGGPVVFLYGPAGSFTQNSPNRPCQGVTVGISNPQVGAVINADGLGSVTLGVNAPPAACGKTLQVVDLTSCLTTNTVVL